MNGSQLWESTKLQIIIKFCVANNAQSHYVESHDNDGGDGDDKKRRNKIEIII